MLIKGAINSAILFQNSIAGNYIYLVHHLAMELASVALHFTGSPMPVLTLDDLNCCQETRKQISIFVIAQHLRYSDHHMINISVINRTKCYNTKRDILYVRYPHGFVLVWSYHHFN